MVRSATDVRAFWFGDPPATEARDLWFRKDTAFDAAVRERYADTLAAALQGGLRDWDQTPAGALARIVVLDQFTRNAFRDTPRAFAGDALALAAATALADSGGHLQLPPLQRWFAYLPLEHAEDLAAQERALRLYEDLAADDPTLAGALEWAQKHHAVVARFGRFPHRNAVLGRPSSAEEAAFLRQPGSRRKATSSTVLSRPRMALRCGKRPKRATTAWCLRAHSSAPTRAGSSVARRS